VVQSFSQFAVFFFEIESCVPSFLVGDCFSKIETPRVLLLVVGEVIGTRIGGFAAVTNDTHSCNRRLRPDSPDLKLGDFSF
jgi:hypothetical protein